MLCLIATCKLLKDLFKTGVYNDFSNIFFYTPHQYFTANSFGVFVIIVFFSAVEVPSPGGATVLEAAVTAAAPHHRPLPRGKQKVDPSYISV